MHECKLISVCGEMLCGMCFAQKMEIEKLVAPKRLPIEMVMIHRVIMRKVK